MRPLNYFGLLVVYFFFLHFTVGQQQLPNCAVRTCQTLQMIFHSINNGLGPMPRVQLEGPIRLYAHKYDMHLYK